MGSLPNLTQLSREDKEINLNVWRVRGRAIRGSHSHSGTVHLRTHTPMCQRSRGRPRPRTHMPLRYCRSAGANTTNTIHHLHENTPLKRLPSSGHTSRCRSIAHRQQQSAQSAQFNMICAAESATSRERRESEASSSGATSVRQLIDVVRSTPSHLGPVYSRRFLWRNFAALSLGHAMVTAAFVPLLALQGSISTWWWPPEIPIAQITPKYFQTNVDIGSLFLALMFSLGSVSSIFTPLIIRKIGAKWCLTLSYVIACIFFAVHLYPKVFTLLIGYLLMGILLGPLAGSRMNFLMTLATKMTYVLSEEEESQIQHLQIRSSRQELLIERLSRGLQLAHDLGLIVGNFVASLLLWYTITTVQEMNDTYFILDSIFKPLTCIDRVCGHVACPPTSNDVKHDTQYLFDNSTEPFQKLVLPCKTTTMLASVFLGCCVMGVALTAAFIDHIQSPLPHPSRNSLCCSAFKNMRQTFKDPRLQLVAPLSIFIGLEQGFMYADFSKSYVVCALGVVNIPLIFLSLGILQCIAGFTLSMLLQHIRRYIAIVMGFAFHSCLLMVLLLWKPTGDDAALFYVIAAAWGVCNSIWDSLKFSLIVSLYPDKWQGPMAHCYCFHYLGLALAFGLHGAICNWLKVYCLAGAMLLSVIPYVCLEKRFNDQRKVVTL